VVLLGTFWGAHQKIGDIFGTSLGTYGNTENMMGTPKSKMFELHSPHSISNPQKKKEGFRV